MARDPVPQDCVSACQWPRGPRKPQSWRDLGRHQARLLPRFPEGAAAPEICQCHAATPGKAVFTGILGAVGVESEAAGSLVTPVPDHRKGRSSPSWASTGRTRLSCRRRIEPGSRWRRALPPTAPGSILAVPVGCRPPMPRSSERPVSPWQDTPTRRNLIGPEGVLPVAQLPTSRKERRLAVGSGLATRFALEVCFHPIGYGLSVATPAGNAGASLRRPWMVPMLQLTAVVECENDIRWRFTLWPSGDAHLPSCLSHGAATSCGPAAR